MTVCYYFEGRLDLDYCGVYAAAHSMLLLMRAAIKSGDAVLYVGREQPQRCIYNPWVEFLGLDDQKNIYAYPVRRDDIAVLYRSYDVCDVIFIESRPWYSRYSVHDRQYRHVVNMIKDANQRGAAVVLFDTDNWVHMYPRYDNMLLVTSNIFFHKLWPRDRQIYLWHYDPDFTEFPLYYSDRVFDICYIGNDYNRRVKLMKYLSYLAHRYKVLVTGNWNRTKVKEFGLRSRDFINLFPVMNIGQTPHWTTIPLTRRCKFTLYVAQPEYERLGYVVYNRTAINYMAGTLAIVDPDIRGADMIYPEELLIWDPADVDLLFEEMDDDKYTELLNKFGRKQIKLAPDDKPVELSKITSSYFYDYVMAKVKKL